MSVRAVLGCLFGDEAKAKIVDVLAVDTDVVIRFQGGSNAGHTINFNNEKFVMHLIPSGIFHKNQICALASGVVIDPFQLEKEINALQTKGVSFSDRFFVDERAALVLPIHKVLDERNEQLSGDNKIGTTKRGIGPCYSDVINRIGLRICDLYNKETLKTKIDYLYKFHNIKSNIAELNVLMDDLFNFADKMSKYVVNLPYCLNKWLEEDKKILFEGAQGTLLDIYFGTYPFVTSSHTLSGGIATYTGCSPKKIDEFIGVYKSYISRVGSGPFPTELNNEIGEKIRIQGNEFGSTTGRPRRCGWFDIVAAKYTAMINGIDSIALTLLDVLSGFDTLKICIAYKVNNKMTEEFPSQVSVLDIVEPVYMELPGWKENISLCTKYEELPENAQNYVKTVERLMGITVKIISVGPDRKQTIFI
jgi:adenylosuccinate synthase